MKTETLFFKKNENAETASDGRATLSGAVGTVATSTFILNITQGNDSVNRESAGNAEEVPNGIMLPTAEEAELAQGLENEPEQNGGSQNVQDEVAVAELPTGDQLLDSARQYKVPEQTVLRVQRISEAIDRNVVFYEGQDTDENGKFDRVSGTIYVNAKSRNPVAQIITHELTHSLEKTESYGKLRSMVLRHIQEAGGDLENLRVDGRAICAPRP